MRNSYTMTPFEIKQLFSQLQYKSDIRRPPDNRRRGQFQAGWEDATIRSKVYAERTLERLTWRNLGYRLGIFFGYQPPDQIRQAFEIFVGLSEPATDVNDWRTDVKRWLHIRWNTFDAIADSIVSFFELAFDHTHNPAHAWFGVHQSTVSLVVGGIFLASIMKSSQDRGFWLLIDQPLPIDGIEYHPVKSTQGSKFPLVWAHAASLSCIPALLTYDLLWQSFASASEKIYYAPRIASDRDVVQERRKKKRLSDFWYKDTVHLFPDEIERESPIREGAKYQITVNAYERDPRARRQCLAHYGTQCFICGFSFGAVYGEVAAGFIHVHHLRSLAEIGAEYIVDPVEDLRPVCPNCHAVLHLRKPAFTPQEIMELLRQRRA